jgi:hypothetical protein
MSYSRTVTLNGEDIVIERPCFAKGTRINTILQKIYQQMPEIEKLWRDYSRRYAEENAVVLDRMQAMARFGPALEHIADAEWERTGQTFKVPASPSMPEIVMALAPVVYTEVEGLALRLLALLAMDNRTVMDYVDKDRDITDRLDEFARKNIQPAGFDEVMDLLEASLDVIDTAVLAKVEKLVEKVGKLRTRLGFGKSSTTSSETPLSPNTVSAGSSPSDTTGSPETYSDSHTTSSSTSESSMEIKPSTVTTAA